MGLGILVEIGEAGRRLDNSTMDVLPAATGREPMVRSSSLSDVSLVLDNGNFRRQLNCPLFFLWLVFGELSFSTSVRREVWLVLDLEMCLFKPSAFGLWGVFFCEDFNSRLGVTGDGTGDFSPPERDLKDRLNPCCSGSIAASRLTFILVLFALHDGPTSETPALRELFAFKGCPFDFSSVSQVFPDDIDVFRCESTTTSVNGNSGNAMLR